MGQPKHRTSKSKTRHRRSHHGVGLPQLVKDKHTGELKKAHFINRKKKSVETIEPEVVKAESKKKEEKSE